MASKELYDYLDVAVPDNDQTLSTPTPQKILGEKGSLNQVVHIGDDESEERIGFSTKRIFYVTLQWDFLSEADAGTIMDFYFDAAKGNGRIESFKWAHPTDGHTYVVRFDCDLTREIEPGSIHGIKKITFKVLGKITD